MEELSGLEVLADKSSTLDRSSEKSMSLSNSISSQIEEDSLVDLQPDSLKAVIPITSTSFPTHSQLIPSELFETCLALSCNPSDLNCKFWRSSGENRWEIGSAGRITNPLTGIPVPPSSAHKFLVAPFLDAHVTGYTLVSESLTVPHMEPVFFCFHDYIATHGLRLSICTDNMDCFYKKNTLLLGNAVDENKKWNIHCVKLPTGKYELRVMAENLGGNKGEVGFLPIRLSRDPDGQEFIC
uniref:MAM domain-containing protein n=1 Tax=Angiostrongylus cantonensis TaxID=6313 RepID=A0A0K0DQV0_ANGCA